MQVREHGAGARLTVLVERDDTDGVSERSTTLLLVPTALELRRLVDLGGIELAHGSRAVCGFGVVAAAARTAERIATLAPARVLLIGIAGSFDLERAPIGSARAFDAVAIDGIGAGEGERAIGPPALGFPQWPGELSGRIEPIEDRIALTRAGAARAQGDGLALLLTTCSASDSSAHAALRKRRFADALAEDMEGFGVAFACALAGVPLAIVRGISNAAGDRDPAHWKIPAALAAARQEALRILRDPHGFECVGDGAARG